MPDENIINRYNPAAPSTYEGVKQQGELAKAENYTPSTLPETTTPIVPNYMYGEGVFESPKLPDYQTRLAEAKYEEPYIAKEISNSYSSDLSKNSYNGMFSSVPRFDPYGPKVSIRESHVMGNDGVWRTKYPNYFPGINNEDYYARRQTGWNKFWNGVGKFALKSALYGASGTVALPNMIANMASEGSFKAALNTDLDKWVGDLDQQIDMLLPHYYRKETEDYNLGQRMFKDTGNFLWNDVLGTGMSFTVGAMISAYATGGLGIASLGNIGAKLGGRIGAKIAARQIANKGYGSLKSVFNNYVRKGVSAGRKIGEATKSVTLLATSAGFESSVEANSFMKQSEKDFKGYFRNIYGRDPNAEELATFRNSNASVGSAVFAANMGILSLSNWLLFGKYIGVGKKAITGIENKINKNIFGLGTEVVKPGEMAIKITNPNIGQQIAAHSFNILKRPMSEGLWEEGTQGVAQNAADEYVKSRYDKVAMNGAVDVLDAIADGFEKQYTTKEGWTEVGIGAIIGSLFGIRQGFGIREYGNARSQLESQIKEYNKATSNLNVAALNTLKRSISLGPQVRSDAETMTNREFDDAMFEKMSVDNQMGTLDDSFENFQKMVEMMPLSEIAEANGMSMEEAEEYKGTIIDNYKDRLSDYRASQKFADDLIGDDAKVEFRKYVARNAFLGLQSEERMMSIGHDLAELSYNPSVEDALNTYSKLSADAREKAASIRGLKTRIEEIEAEITDLATRPRNVNGTDPESEAIQKKTKELEQLRLDYNKSLAELSTLVGKEFSVSELIYRRKDITEEGVLTPTDPQSVIDAYETLTAFDDYFNVKSRRKEEFTEKDKAMRQLVDEYRRSLVDYRNMNNFLLKTLDKRFLAEEEKGFAKALSSLFAKEYKGDDTLPYFMESGKIGEYKNDEIVDQALSEGRISNDEAFTIKAFMHSIDRIREARREGERDDVDHQPLTESVSDEDYETALEVPISVPSVRESIIDKLYTGNEDLLTEREREVYNKYKQDFDDYVSNMGDSPAKLIKGISEKAERFARPKSVYEANNFIIEAVRSMLSPEDQAELDKAIKAYKEIMNKRDKGENVDEDKLAEAVLTIETLGNVGNINNLVPFIEQNRTIENGVSADETLINFGEEDIDIEVLTNEVDEKDKTSGSNIDSAQNPEVLTVRRITTESGTKYEVSGLRADKFISMIKSAVPMQVSSETMPNGLKKYSINIGGEVVTIQELPYHARWVVDGASARVLNLYTDVAIQDVGNVYSLIYKRLDSGELIPYRTGVGFGVNETDRIDQDALAEVKKGDDVQLEVDVNDTYNQSLIKEYNDAVQSGEKDRIDKAEKNLISNMVIKVMKGGKFISVVKSDTGNIEGISNVRRSAFDKWKKDAGKSSVISVGTHKVAQTLPGRLVFNMEVNSQGYGEVKNLPITEKGAENIVDVGYVLNGKVFLKNGTKYTGFPFGTYIIRDKSGFYKDKRVPVVVVKGKNGLNYILPVSLRSVESEEGKKWISFIDTILNSNDPDLGLIQEDLQDLNAYLTRLGLYPDSYQISYLNPIPGLINARRAIEKMSTVPDVMKWVEDDSRSVKEIVTSDVESGVDFEGEIFVAPKIRIQFGKTSSKKKPSKVEDDVPFNEEGGAAKGSSIEDNNVNTEEGTTEEETGTQNNAAAPTPSMTEKRRSSRKGFPMMLDAIEQHIKSEGLPTFANIYDFIARKIVGGEIRFLRERNNPESLKSEMGLDAKGTVGDKISATAKNGGMTFKQYVDYLRSSKEQVVMDYVANRSDEQIISELKNFLGYIKFVPSKALNYSLRVNGMDTVKEYGTQEEVDAMESALNSMVSTEIPESNDQVEDDLASDIESGHLSDTSVPMENMNFTDEEKIEFLNNIAEFLNGISGYEGVAETVEKESDKISKDGEEGDKGGSEVRDEEDGDKTVTGEEQGQPGNGVKVEGDVQLSGSDEGKVKRKIYILQESTMAKTNVIARFFVYGGDAAYTSVPADVQPIPADAASRNEIKYGMSHEDLEDIGYKSNGHWVYKPVPGTKFVDMYNIASGEAFRARIDDITKIERNYDFWGSLSQDKRRIIPFKYTMSRGLRMEDVDQVEEELPKAGRGPVRRRLYILRESSNEKERVIVNSFMYGGDAAYVKIPADVQPIPDEDLLRAQDDIKIGMDRNDLKKIGYEKEGNWVSYHEYGTDYTDMYNIATGEAFRIRFPNDSARYHFDSRIELWQAFRNIKSLFDNDLDNAEDFVAQTEVIESPVSETEVEEDKTVAGEEQTENGVEAESGPFIEEERGPNITKVLVPTFLYGGNEAYVSVPAEVQPIPEKIVSRSGIRFGMGAADLTKLGYKRAGGNWFYKFYMNTGLYDLYNINTGEAFRLKPNKGVSINSSKFILSLSQSGRNIQNMRRSVSQEEIERDKNLVDKSNNKDSENQINTKCD